jgi:hypothetical protein
MKTPKPPAALSLDLDNQWSYMKIHGDAGWDRYPTYLPVFLPYVLDLLDELNLKITFFIVGQDASMEINRPWLRMITERGHEVGNHSFRHESWIQAYSPAELEEELASAEESIRQATGQVPRGFRGPGFSWSVDLLKLLKKKNYLYDASTLPTYIGPLARLYYFWTSRLTKEEKEVRKYLFGKFSDGFRPLKPYRMDLGEEGNLLEIPVTTIPVFKVPFHLSYLLYLSGYSMVLMRIYLRFALFMCRITRTPVSFLLHPLDLISGDEVPELSFFPGMQVPSEKKKTVFRLVIRELARHYTLMPMSAFAEERMKTHLPVKKPR